MASEPFNQFDENRCHFFTPLACGGHGSFWENVVPREIAHYFGWGHRFAFNQQAIDLVNQTIWQGQSHMPTTAELKTRREALAASRSSGVARMSYDGKTVDYRSLAEIDRAIEVLDREIATAEGRRIIRQVRVITTKGL